METKIDDRIIDLLWTKTDDTQYVKKTGEDSFIVIEVLTIGEEYGILNQEVKLSDYDENEILECIKTFGYNSIKEVSDIYQEAANQIIAECLAESNPGFIEESFFKTVDEAVRYIEEEIIEIDKLNEAIKLEKLNGSIALLQRGTHSGNSRAKDSMIQTIFKRLDEYKLSKEKCERENMPDEYLRFKHYVECLDMMLAEIKCLKQ